ncbi:hypothetical protein ACFL59_00635 [Planctomycetota bacterium]
MTTAQVPGTPAPQVPGSPTTPPTTPTLPLSQSATQRNLTLTIEALDSTQTPRVLFAPGEPITLVARYTNNGTTDETLTSTDGCGITDETIDGRFGGVSSPVFNRLYQAMCTMILIRHTIAAGQSKETSHTWDQLDNAGGAVPRGNYRFTGSLRGSGTFPWPTPLEIGIGDNVVRVQGTALNNGIVPSEARVSVGLEKVTVSQSRNQTALQTAQAIAQAIDATADYAAVATDLGGDVAEVRVGLASTIASPYHPVVYDVTANDPAQQVTAP